MGQYESLKFKDPFGITVLSNHQNNYGSHHNYDQWKSYKLLLRQKCIQDMLAKNLN